MLKSLNAKENEAGPRSQARAAYEIIRGDILRGRHPPSHKLKIQELALEIGVSPGAVREALSRLVPEQLVVSRDQRGFIVAPLSIEDLEDLTDLRCEIEAIALRRSVERGTLDWEAALIAAAHRLNATQPRPPGQTSGVNSEWVIAHSGFHAALVAACGSPRLLALHAQLYEQSERYRGITAHFDTDRDVAQEHREILDLALERNADALIAKTVAHLRTTTDLITASVERDRRQ